MDRRTEGGCDGGMERQREGGWKEEREGERDHCWITEQTYLGRGLKSSYKINSKSDKFSINSYKDRDIYIALQL